MWCHFGGWLDFGGVGLRGHTPGESEGSGKIRGVWLHILIQNVDTWNDCFTWPHPWTII